MFWKNNVLKNDVLCMLAVASASDVYTHHVRCVHGLLAPLLTFAWSRTCLLLELKKLPHLTAMASLKTLGLIYSPRRIRVASSA
jgi:hypothetical protein